MNPIELDRRALGLYQELSELSSAQRQTRLANVRQESIDLHDRVVSLLHADSDSDLFATDYSGESQIVFTKDQLDRPERVGPYRVTELIGQGGMGVVYRAERDDGRFDQTVAIKLMNVAWSSDELRDRFENERRIAAQLEHPNIARMYDGGEVDGRPYIVMEFVEGDTLSTCAVDGDQERALEQFCNVCDALDYAHDKLVLHRDIKPGNIIVTEQGVPKLLDFGIAKITGEMTDEAHLTQVGGMPMTPAYTSPECLVGEPATVRSEVYSLGVLLYELLHNQLPFDLAGLSLLESHEQIVGGQKLLSTGVQDLDVIINVAMHVDPARRYASAAALAADVHAYLRGDAISARKDELGYLVRRFVSRNKVAVGASFAALVAMIGGLTAATVAYVNAENAREEAVVARASAEEQTVIAENAVAFLGATLAGGSPHQGLGPSATIEDALMRSEALLNAASNETPESLAFLHSVLAQVYSGLSRPKQAMVNAYKAAELVEQHIGARGYSNAGAWVEAAIGASELQQGLSWADQAVAAYRNGSWTDLDSFLILLVSRAEIRSRVGRVDEARIDAQEVIALHDTIGRGNTVSLASVNNLMGMLEAQAGDHETALKYYDESLEVLTALQQQNFPNALQLRMNRAGTLDSLGRWNEAKVAMHDTLRDMEQELGEHHQWVIWGAASLGLAYHKHGDSEAGKELMQHYLERSLTSGEFVEHDETIAYIQAKLGFAQCSSGDLNAGLANLEAALVTRQVLFPPEYWGIGDVQGAIGICLTGLGRFDEAEAVLLDAFNNYLAFFGADHTNTDSIRRWLVDLYEASGQPEKAQPYRVDVNRM